MADRFAKIKTYDAYPFARACRAIAIYGAVRTDAKHQAMEEALSAADKASDSAETREMLTRLTEVAHKIAPVKPAPPRP